MTQDITVHADQDLIGRRGVNHPPLISLDPMNLRTSAVDEEITCAWCRRALGLLAETPLPEKEESKARGWTVYVSVSGEPMEAVSFDADRIEVNEGPPSVSFLRDDKLVAGFPLGRVVYWVSEDATLDTKEAPAS